LSLASQLQTVEGPFSVDDRFLQNIWGKKPLIFKNAFEKGKWPSWKEVINNSMDESLDSRLITHEPGDLESFEMEIGPFESEDLEDLMEAPAWTLMVNDMDRVDPALASWMDNHFAFLPRWRRDDGQVSIASEGGGIGPHVDNYDVFLVQTQGRREWMVGQQPMTHKEESTYLVPGVDIRVLDLPSRDGYDNVILQPGDILYVPPRFVHSGTSLSPDCMTLSVGYRSPSAAELLARVTEQAQQSVKGQYRFVDNLDYYGDHKAGMSLHVSHRNQMKQLVRDAVEEILNDASRWDKIVGQVVTEEKRYLGWNGGAKKSSLPAEGCVKVQGCQGVTFATSVVLSAEDEHVIRLFAQGAMWEVPNNPISVACFQGIERGTAVTLDCHVVSGTVLHSAISDLLSLELLYLTQI